MAWSLDDRTGPTRPLQVTCTLVVRWWASSLRRSPHGCAGLRDRAGKVAPPVRVPRATLGLPTDCELRRLDPDHRTQNSPKTRKKPTTTKRPRADQDRPTLNAAAPCALLSLLASGSALLRVPAGSFEKRGRSSFPVPHSPNRPMTNDLPDRCMGKIGGKSARRSEFLWFPSRVLGFPGSFCSTETVSMSGEGCNLVCGEGDRQLA